MNILLAGWLVGGFGLWQKVKGPNHTLKCDIIMLSDIFRYQTHSYHVAQDRECDYCTHYLPPQATNTQSTLILSINSNIKFCSI